jgi:tRNA A37 threonylcarbamoyladenosine biosynthesis protein TsaE
VERVELVGRQNQVDTVTDVVHRALTGPARLLLLGEAGAGKTTLLHAAIDLAHRTARPS